MWGKSHIFLWLGHRPTAAAPIRTLAQELPYATIAAVKRKNKNKKESLKRTAFIINIKIPNKIQPYIIVNYIPAMQFFNIRKTMGSISKIQMSKKRHDEI